MQTQRNGDGRGARAPDLAPGDSNFETDHCDGTYTGSGARAALLPDRRGRALWKYIPKLLTWSYDGDMTPCPLRDAYQLVRTLLAACVLPDGCVDEAAHAVLLYDRRNPAFCEGGKGWQAYESVRRRLKNEALLKRVSWQELLACLRQDSDLDWLTAAIRDKYGM